MKIKGIFLSIVLCIFFAACGGGGGDDAGTGTPSVPPSASTLKNICSRTQQVREAILAKIHETDTTVTCSTVTEAHLAGITGLDLSAKSIASLQTDDFDDLAGLTELLLNDNDLTALPEDVFEELSSLVELRLSRNMLRTLPSGLFEDLSSLTDLYLSGNPFSAPPLICSGSAVTCHTENKLPSFAAGTGIDNQNYINGVEIDELELPAAEAGSGNEDLSYSIDPVSPFGLTFNPDTRILSGTPSSAGMETITYTVVDADEDMTSRDSAMLQFTVNVAEDTAPGFAGQMIGNLQYVPNFVITPVPLPQASGGNGPLTYSLSSLPDGLDFNTDTRVLSGTPTTVGTTSMTYTATDVDGDETTTTFTIEITQDAMPGFAGQTINDQQYVENVAITTFELPQATGGNGILTYTLAPLPAGLDFNADTRVLSGSPTMLGNTDLIYTVQDGDEDTQASDTATLEFTITVVANDAPMFASGITIAARNYIEGVAITPVDLPLATGGNGPLEYSLTGLPAGLQLESGQLIGTPAEVVSGQTATYTVMDADGDMTSGDEATLTFTLTVAANESPSFAAGTGIDNRDYINGVEIDELQLPAAETGSGNGDLSYSIAPVSPFGLTFNSDTRTLSGTPSSAGMETITYTVVDADGDMTSGDETMLQFTVNVAEDTAPGFAGQMIGNLQYLPNFAITPVPLPAAMGGNGPLTYSLSSLPDGLDFNTETRVLGGTPTTVGTTSMTYTVRDVNGDETPLMFTIEIIQDAMPGFAGQTINDQQYVENVAITRFELPAASGGNGILMYSLAPLPAGLDFNADTRVLSGSPTMLGNTDLIYTVRDGDEDAQASDTATLEFTIMVVANDAPMFASGITIAARNYIEGVAITPVDLPLATGGNGPLEYSLTGLPAGLRLESGQLVGTPAEVVSGQTATYTVMDADGDMTSGDEATLTFTLTVAANELPSFAAAGTTIGVQNYINGVEIDELQLPAAEAGSGNGDLSYSITPASPFGLTFNPDTRILSGTPSSAGMETITYTVVDADGDMTSGDEATLQFTVNVAEDTAPGFAGQMIGDLQYVPDFVITPVPLPQASGGNGPLTYSLSSLPDGLDFNAETRVLSGTPTTVSTTSMTYTVRDVNGDETPLMFTIEIIQDAMPGFAGQTISDQQYVENVAITTFELPAASGGNGTLTYTLAPLPAGISFNRGTRELSGSPTILGSTDLIYTVQDGDEDTQASDTATLEFTITVVANDAPMFGTTIDDQNYIEGVAITPVDLPLATGGNGPLEYSLTGLPAGLRLESGQLIGTPAEVVSGQTATYTVMDADGDMTSGDEATLTFTLTVAANESPSFAAGTGIDNRDYINGVEIDELQLPAAEAGSGNGDLTYSITPASPFGLMFNSDTRTLSGTPSSAGMETITYTVVDADGDMTSGDEATLQFTVNVAEDTAPGFAGQMIGNLQYLPNFAITPVPLPQAMGGNGPLTYSLSSRPDGLDFNTETRVLGGTPTTVGTTSMTYTARDVDGDETTLTFTIEIIRDAMPGFAGQTINDQQYVENVAITTFELPAASGGNGILMYSLAPLPDGLDFNADTRVLSGSPTAAGSTDLIYTVRDGDEDALASDTATLEFTITVVANDAPMFTSGITIDDQNYIEGVAVAPLDLPLATGGNGPLEYSLTGLPAGLRLESGQLVGTPAEIVSGQTATYTVMDSDGDMTSGDESALSFDIGIRAPRTTNICHRTFGVRASILAQIHHTDNTVSCHNVNERHLASITRLRVSHSFLLIIVFLREDDFHGLSGLRELDLSVSHFDAQELSLPAKVFNGLSSLTKLNLANNILDDLFPVHEDLFEGLSKLTELNLRGAFSAHIPANLFEGLSSLRTLDLSHNVFTNLPADVFDELSGLRTLNLSSNGFSSLPADVFDGLSGLTTLDLSQNHFTSLPAGLFDELESLTRLDLRGNRLDSTPEICDEEGITCNL